MDYLFLLQGSNPGLKHCRQTLYTLSHQRKDLGNDERLVTHSIDTNTVYLTKDETHLGKKKMERALAIFITFCNCSPRLLISLFCCHCCCLVTKSRLTLCNPTECSLSGSPVHGIFQARILEWVAIFFSRGSSQPRDQTLVSCTGDTTELHGKPLSLYTYLKYSIVGSHTDNSSSIHQVIRK